MAVAKFTIGQVNISGWLLINAYFTYDLTTVVDSQSFNPATISTSFNVEFDDLVPGVYKFDFRDSPDGTALGLLLATFTIDVQATDLEFEYKFYTTGGLNDGDPVSDQSDLIDDYLDGKNIVGVFKEGSRFLIPGTEYSFIAGGGVHLENGAVFSEGESFIVQIANTVSVANTTSGLFAGSATITANTTLDGNYLNKKIKCASGTSQLVVTLAPVSTIADGKFYYFTTHSGSQHQTRFLTQGGEQIEGYGSEIVLGKNEHLWLEKRGSQFEVLDVHDNVNMVGMCGDCQYKSHINVLPADFTLVDGDEYPRIYNWLRNTLPATHYITDANVINGGYTPTVGKEGMYVIHPTLKKFRMPNLQGWVKKGLKSMGAYGTDSLNRLYDYPGGTQPEQVGPHFHETGVQRDSADPNKFGRGASHNVGSKNASPKIDTGQTASTDINKENGNVSYTTENRVKNVGVIFYIRI